MQFLQSGTVVDGGVVGAFLAAAALGGLGHAGVRTVTRQRAAPADE